MPDGSLTDALGAHFRGKRVRMILPAGVLNANCAHNSQNDRCDFLTDQSISGIHESSCCGFRPASGTDTYDLQLQNGWRFAGSWFGEIEFSFPHTGVCAYHGVGYAFSPALPGQPYSLLYGATSMHLQVDWNTVANIGSACYTGTLWIEGPAGIPFK